MRIRFLVTPFLLLSLLSLSACRFKLPSSSEGHELKTSGAFPEKIPAWVNTNNDKAPGGAKTSGLIPEHYSAPTPAISTDAAVEDDTAANRSKAEKKEKAAAAEAAEAAAATEGTEEGAVPAEGVDAVKSPIAKIETLCPGTEQSVSDALRTENTQERIRKYTTLTYKCPESSHLWVWLGKDYETQNQLADAVRCYERALIADPTDRDAAALLAGVKERINK